MGFWGSAGSDLIPGFWWVFGGTMGCQPRGMHYCFNKVSRGGFGGVFGVLFWGVCFGCCCLVVPSAFRCGGGLI